MQTSAFAVKLVMPGLVPGIHVLIEREKDVDGRNKSGHDEGRTVCPRFSGRVKAI
jgi:hypothetical protein